MFTFSGEIQHRIDKARMARDQHTAAQYRLAQLSRNGKQKPSIARRIVLSILASLES